VATWAYIEVVSSFWCPSKTWMTRISTFCSSRCVAKQWRSVCIDTRLSIPAAFAAACTARLSCRVLSDSIGLSPGNSQPPSSILPWARATPPGT